MRTDLKSLPISRIIFDEHLFGLNCKQKTKIIIFRTLTEVRKEFQKIKLTSRQVETMVFGSRAAAIK